MRIQLLNSINFKSYLPKQQEGKTDGWSELERLCQNSPEQKAMLYQQLELLSQNGDNNILALEHTPQDYSFVNESFSFRLYKNEEDLEKDRMSPSRNNQERCILCCNIAFDEAGRKGKKERSYYVERLISHTFLN